MKARIFDLTFLAIALIAAGFYFWNSRNDFANYPPKNLKIAAFGDSLIQGVGASPGNDFVSLVGKDVGINIENYGLNGDTTDSALKRVDQVLSYDPGIVILLLGGNDVLRRLPKEETFANLESIITQFQNNGTMVVLLGIRGGLWSDVYENDFENLADKYRLPYVSNVLEGILGKQKLMHDSIHPNENGYKIIAERVTDVMEDILK